MTTPVRESPSGRARNAAKRFPSSLWRTRSSWETAAPEIRGIGGSESSSKHIAPERTKGGFGCAAYPEGGGGRVAAGRDERRDPRPARAGSGAAVDAPGGRGAVAAAAGAAGTAGTAHSRTRAAEARTARQTVRLLKPYPAAARGGLPDGAWQTATRANQGRG